MKNVFQILLLVSGLIFYSCGKDDKEEDRQTTPVIRGCMDPYSDNYNPNAVVDNGTCVYTAGNGGNAKIVTRAEHHGYPIFSDSSYNDSVFIKFNSLTSPGTNPWNYDRIEVGHEYSLGGEYVEIDSLKRGKYYIYMTGWDPTIGERVTGGKSYELDTSAGAVLVIVPVTE